MKKLNKPTKGVQRDSATESIWQRDISYLKSNPTIATETIYDVLIIGGGITGITTAFLLQQAGQKCLLVEAHTLGYGTTGGTTAHINTFLDNPYNQIEKDFGEVGAKLTADATKEAIELIKGLIDQYNIDCDFVYKNGYLFAENNEEASELSDIMRASQKAGVEVSYSRETPVPLNFVKAIVYSQQASFHPLKYIYRLAKEFINLGGTIVQNTTITGIEKKDGYHLVHSTDFVLKADKVAYATHIPPGINLLHFECAPYRSYVLAARLSDNDYPQHLAYDMKDPYHYFRTQKIDGKEYLILGGDDHKTGHGNPDESFKSLERYVNEHYKVASVDFRWSAQYFVAADGLPYIGKLPGFDSNVYVATGFGGNGIILGSISAKIICDLILNMENKYADLFSPSRIKPIAGFADFVKENADVAYHFIKDRFQAKDIDSLNDIEPDSGAIIEYQNHKLAVYKDAAGEIHALNPVCTHARCIVNWNNSEKSWDCPCHGARYDINGEVLNGPADRGLEKVEIDG